MTIKARTSANPSILATARQPSHTPENTKPASSQAKAPTGWRGPDRAAVDNKKVLASLNRLSIDGKNEGLTVTMPFSRLPWAVQRPIGDAVEALKARTLAKDGNATFGEPIISSISEVSGAMVGYTVELPITTNGRDADRRLSFSKSGAPVGDERVRR